MANPPFRQVGDPHFGSAASSMVTSKHRPKEAGTRSRSGTLASAGLPWPWAGLIALALGAQLALIWTHVPWGDELQATALARESHDLADWYWNFRYEGHAPLWHLLLKIPLAFTDDPTALKIVQSLAILCSAALIHLRAPFSPRVKFLLSLNYFLFFEYGVIARDYSLTIVFFFGAIAFRRQPLAWLFIALLPQGGLQSVMFAGICGLIVLREQGWRPGGVLLAACGGAVALIWMWPAADFESLNSLRLAEPFLSRILRAAYLTGTTLLPVEYDLGLTGWEAAREPLLILTAGVVGPIYAIRYIGQQNRFSGLLTALFVLANLCLSVAFYAIATRHFGLWIILAIGMGWTTQEKGETPRGLAPAWLLVLALSGLGAGLRQTTAPFSTTLQTSQALRENGGLTTLIIPAYALLGAEVNGILRIPTYDMAGECLQTFVRWRRPVFMPPPFKEFVAQRDMENAARRGLDAMKVVAAHAGGHALLFFDPQVGETISTLEDPALTFLRFIGKDSPYEQRRYLYRLDVPPDPKPAPIPTCAR